ncbi:MAG: ABC transporter ATP-binding protein [Candidatus Thermoplasmatota archaeon]|nr:ABC transporter ATP-binding protein [Candidatus Thermoplasmatota archaeon]MCL5791176.1 ABC transporter ATP-binding protein [Candidatus Thermoplasmatota archaeon]
MSSQFGLYDIKKNYGKFTAISVENLEFDEDSYIVVLGPSGSGKTTLLRIVSGLETPDQGKVVIGGEDVTNVPSWKRSVGLVFQNYALYPHLTVYQNIAIPLTVEKRPLNEIRKSVDEVVEVMQLHDQIGKLPKQLSGGQQQRVALARAIVKKPKILLMDEPLSNLDTRVRVDLRGYLKDTQRKLGITVIHVTHDQEEAMALGDSVVVVHKGEIVQQGTPREVYGKPRNLFVAGFLGGINLFRKEDIGSLGIDGAFDTMGIRNEDIYIVGKDDPHQLSGIAGHSQYLGSQTLLNVSIGDIEIMTRISKDKKLKHGTEVGIILDLKNAIFFQDGKRVDIDVSP